MMTTIQTLFEQGYNKTQIARMLKVDRKTVRKVLKAAEEGQPIVPKKPHPSQFDPYRDYILSKLEKDLSTKRIYQDLCREYGISGSYSSLGDYIRKIRPPKQTVYMVLHAQPGEEAQVDFGYIGTLNVGGRRRKAWVFVMSLSCSRYLYAEICLDQSVKTFIRCHVNAFRYFEGVPKTVKIDNLKAAVTEVDFYEPLTQRTYAAFAKHYGFLPELCRVYTPTDKGKIESNVKYVKNNCFKGRDFENVTEAEMFLSEWLTDIANARKHGTTKKIPREEYIHREQPKLLPLPKEEFFFSKSQRAIVNTDCHISYQANYYSVPFQYLGFEVDVIEVNSLLRIYYKEKEIALHTLAGNQKGEHVTDKNHYPSNKRITQEEILSRQKEKMEEIGEAALEFFNRYVSTCEYIHSRTISGILALRKRYSDAVINQACARACHYGNISYRTVKNICEKGLEMLPLTADGAIPADVNTDKASVSKVRDLSEYRILCGLGAISHE